MNDMETRLRQVEARAIAAGIAVQLMLHHLGPDARAEIAHAADQIVEQGLATTRSDASLEDIRTVLRSYLETD